MAWACNCQVARKARVFYLKKTLDCKIPLIKESHDSFFLFLQKIKANHQLLQPLIAFNDDVVFEIGFTILK